MKTYAQLTLLCKPKIENIPTNSMHMCTIGYCSKQNTNLIWKRNVSALYPYISHSVKEQVTAGKPRVLTMNTCAQLAL